MAADELICGRSLALLPPPPAGGGAFSSLSAVPRSGAPLPGPPSSPTPQAPETPPADFLRLLPVLRCGFSPLLLRARTPAPRSPQGLSNFLRFQPSVFATSHPLPDPPGERGVGARPPGGKAVRLGNGGVCLRCASYRGDLPVPVPPGKGEAPRPGGTAQGTAPQRPWDGETDGGVDSRAGTPSPFAAEGLHFKRRGRGAGLSAGRASSASPGSAEERREALAPLSHSPPRAALGRRRRRSLPPRSPRNAGLAAPPPGCRGKRRSARPGPDLPPHPARPHHPTRRAAGRSGRDCTDPLPTSRGLRCRPRHHFKLQQVGICVLRKIPLPQQTLQLRCLGY